MLSVLHLHLLVLVPYFATRSVPFSRIHKLRFYSKWLILAWCSTTKPCKLHVFTTCSFYWLAVWTHANRHSVDTFIIQNYMLLPRVWTRNLLLPKTEQRNILQWRYTMMFFMLVYCHTSVTTTPCNIDDTWRCYITQFCRMCGCGIILHSTKGTSKVLCCWSVLCQKSTDGRQTKKTNLQIVTYFSI